MNSDYDYIVIGDAVATARHADEYGACVLLVESNRLGGT